MPFTRPLIHVATHITPYPPGLLTAIVSALASMLDRIPSKPFISQLQSTFVKAVSDTSSDVVPPRVADAKEGIAASFILPLSNLVKSSSRHGGIADNTVEFVVELVKEAFRVTRDDQNIQAMATTIASSSANPIANLTDLYRAIKQSLVDTARPVQ
ncbi:hypothetical protein EDD22DRAFT_952267 [Suillus occidentalis]|nr:hypothetical protein EDD22DRAFT_952267 [Suillus occidentalis]